MTELSKQLQKVSQGLVSVDSGQYADISPTSIGLRKAERDLARYFAVSGADREGFSKVIFIEREDPLWAYALAMEKDDPGFADRVAEFPLVSHDLGEETSLNEMIDDWIRECEHSDPVAAFKSMYRILSAIESTEGGEGYLSVDQHSRIVENAAGAAVSSSMPPGHKFVALAGLLKFVGSTDEQYHLVPQVIAPAMQEQVLDMSCGEFCELILHALTVASWETDHGFDDLPEDAVIIDGVAVVAEKSPDAIEDFRDARMGESENRRLVRNMLGAELKKDPYKLLPLLEESDGADRIKSLLYAMEERGDISAAAVQNIPKLLQEERGGLLEQDDDRTLKV